MDPVSVISIAGAAGSLAFKCGKIVQTLHCLRERYKRAELTILSVIQDCRTIRLAWSRIERWAASGFDALEDHEELAERLQLSIYAGQLFMTELEKDLGALDNTPKYSTLRRRTKILWNESMFREHQDRIQRQICALTLLLEVMKLPSVSDRAEMLSIKEPVFRSIEDSVRSIVPTNSSLCSDDAASVRSVESSELCYAPFSFENDLFTSYVYKRNFRVTRLHIKQVQRTPIVEHAYAVVETDTAQPCDVSEIIELYNSDGIIIHQTCDSDSAQSINKMCDSASIGHICANAEPLKNPHGHLSNTQPLLEDLTQKLIRMEGETESNSALSITQEDATVADISSNKHHVEIMHASIGIERKTAVSSENSGWISTRKGHLLHTVNGVLWKQLATGRSEISHERQLIFLEQHVEISSRIQHSVSDTPGELALDRMLYLPAYKVANPERTLAFKALYDRDRSFFGTFMQVLGLMRGTSFMAQFAGALALSYDRILELEDTSLIDGSIVQSNWTKVILSDPSIAQAATSRDIATSTGMLYHTPTVLQLACVAKKALVVEYLLSLGRPLFPLDWKVHPFVLATKRRCKPILELFLKLAKHSISDLIKNIALAMVVNQDCALSGDWMDADQNDNKRVKEDVGIITFLLANGASPNVKDKTGISVLCMAIRAACSLNPFSLQIVDILLRNGAQFGRHEQEHMSAGPVKAFESLRRRHRLLS